MLVIMRGAQVLPNVMMLRTSLAATASIVKKTSLDCRRTGTRSVGLDELERQTGCHDGSDAARWANSPGGLVGSPGLWRAWSGLPVAGTRFRWRPRFGVTRVRTWWLTRRSRGRSRSSCPSAVDPGEMMATVVRPGKSQAPCARIALIDVDGLLLNQNYGSIYAVGDNPLAGFRDKLEAAARDPQVTAVLLRINSPGGSVTACDIMAEELRQFRAETHKPVVACLMDVATSGAYFIAAGERPDRRPPDGLDRRSGGRVQSLQSARRHGAAQPRCRSREVGSEDRHGNRHRVRSTTKRECSCSRWPTRTATTSSAGSRSAGPSMTAQDHQAVQDGRVVIASEALALHLVDRLGYLHDAIAEAEQMTGAVWCEVVLLHRSGYPAHSLYAITPTPAPLNDAIPFSYPGLDRSKLPTFLYLWQPDPTLPRLGSR